MLPSLKVEILITTKTQWEMYMGSALGGCLAQRRRNATRQGAAWGLNTESRTSAGWAWPRGCQLRWAGHRQLCPKCSRPRGTHPSQNASSCDSQRWGEVGQGQTSAGAARDCRVGKGMGPSQGVNEGRSRQLKSRTEVHSF